MKPGARKHAAPQAPAKSRNVRPVETARAHPAAMVAALELAGGDASRLRVIDGGLAVLVANRGRKP